MAALRHTCPVKISLTLPAGVVLPVKSLNFISNNDVLGRVVHSDNCCVNCVHYGANKKSRSKDLSGLASTSVHQLLASSCLGRPAQMSGAPSTSSLEVLKDQCVQGAVLRGKFNHRHTNIDHKPQVRYMHSHASAVGAHQNLNDPTKKVSK